MAINLVRRLLPETMLAKEAKNRFVSPWKTPRLSFGADRGLQYGLSGNRVSIPATLGRGDEKETAPSATGGSPRGKPTRPKP